MKAEPQILAATTYCKPYCDLEKAEKTGRAKWICPTCKADVSMIYLFWSMVFNGEE